MVLFKNIPLNNVIIKKSLRDRDVACTASESCSGGQCHLIHFTILKRFSWPNLACKCTNVT